MKLFLPLNGKLATKETNKQQKKNSTSRIFDADNISAGRYVRHSGWLQNYFNTIQTPYTFENINVRRNNLRILTIIFSV